MRKELVDLIHEAMDQHELARDFYHRKGRKSLGSPARSLMTLIRQGGEVLSFPPKADLR
jgi:hypothetical protein